MKHEIRPRVAAARAAIAASAPPDARKFLRVDIKGDINSATAKAVQKALRAAPAAKTIWLTVNSLGGDVAAAVACYRALREHPAKIISNCYGDCASAAVLPYLAGDIRNAHARSRFMLHAAAITPNGRDRWTADLYALHAAAIRDADAVARAIILERSGMSLGVLDAEMRTEADMPIRKAISNGVVHHVPGITPPLDKAWPARARAAMRSSKTVAFGANGYRYAPTYLAACAA